MLRHVGGHEGPIADQRLESRLVLNETRGRGVVYATGTDTGGTFTGTVVIDERRAITIGKRPSTPHEFVQGVVDSVQDAAQRSGVDELLDRASSFHYGTMIVVNAITTGRVGRAKPVIAHRQSTSAPAADVDATDAFRAELRGQRIGGAPMAAVATTTLPSEHRRLDVNVPPDADEVAHCARCGHVVAQAGESHEAGLRVIEQDLATTDRGRHDPSMYSDDLDPVSREFVCPRCATLIEVEATFRGDARLCDKELVPVNPRNQA